MSVLQGKIRAWIEHKAYGFVIPSDGGEELFFHRKDLRGEARDEGGLQEGDTVSYEKGWDDRNRKDKAKNIHLVKSATAQDRAEAMALRRERERNRPARRKSPSPQSPTQSRRSPSTHRNRDASQKRSRRRSASRSRSSDRGRYRKRRSPSRDRGRRRRRSPSQGEVDSRSREASVVIREVQTFADFVRIAPDVAKIAPRMLTHDLTHLCIKAASVKFYDGDMLDAVISQLRSRFNGKGEDCFGPDGIVKVLCALAELNAYNKDFFGACAKVLEKTPERLAGEQARSALFAFRSTKHEGAEELIEFLSRKTKQENYETAKTELLKRQLNKMYGDTRDLQGAPMDTERALLKKPRSSFMY